MPLTKSVLICWALILGLVLPGLFGVSYVWADSAVMLFSTQLDGEIAGLAPHQAVQMAATTSTTFDLDYGSGLHSNQDAQDAFDRAAARWAGVLADPVTVNITVDVASLGSGILGQTSSVMMYGDYNAIRDLVANGGEAGDPRETFLLPDIPSYSQLSVALPAGFSTDGTGWLAKANYRALGGNPSGSDGAITFSTNFAWDYDPSDGIDAGKFDFEGVAVHEMGHLLGFTSEVDYVDYILALGSTSNSVWPRPLDLFRFETNDLGESFDFASETRNLTPGGSHSFFHQDGSVLMSTGAYTGDGRQASHWKDNLGLGIMDPTFASGELGDFTEADLIALDLIGWDVVSDLLTVPGDVNADGFVNGYDMAIILDNWGLSGATRAQGDLNGDGLVSAYDYSDVVTYWGLGTAPQPVPEPAMLVVLLMVWPVLAGRKHRPG